MQIYSEATYDTGFAVAEFWSFFGQWAANSQYGYPMEWCKSQAEAEAYARSYYAAHPECTAVIDGVPVAESVLPQPWNREPIPDGLGANYE